MNIAELKKIIKEQQEEELQLPPAAVKTKPSRFEWHEYWNNIWIQSQEKGSVNAFPNSFKVLKKLQFDFSEGEFKDCFYNKQQEANMQ